MKKLVMFIAILLINNSGLIAQPLVIDAGKDRHICVQINNRPPTASVNNMTLGGSPTAIGDVVPYTYKWSFFYSTGTSTINASNILNSTSIANPQVDHFFFTG